MHPSTTVTRLAAAALILAAAGAGPAGQRAPIPPRPDDRTIVHVLNRIGYGPRPGDLARVREAGLAAYIDAQLHPERLPDAAMGPRLAPLETTRMTTRELVEEYFAPAVALRRLRQRARDPSMRTGEPAPVSPEERSAARAARRVLLELAQQKVLRAVYSERQLEEVMADFWFNHFNVFAGKGQTRVYLTEYERDAIRPRVLGRFRDLLGATAASPAMLFYLDNWQSAAPEGASTTARPVQPRRGAAAAPNRPRRGLNENYARELLELHTLGVDGGFTQKDVEEVARAFTGWTIANPRQGGGFFFDPRRHDAGGKVVLGRRLAPGGGRDDGERVLDMLASHPATARHIATKLARRFISDDPPRSAIDRAAARFLETRGDIREVVRSVVTSAEFFSPQAHRAKVKTPFEFVVSALRATAAEAASAQPVVQAARDLGMPLYGCQPPTGYADTAAAWLNAGALLGRMNFAVALAGGRLPGVVPDVARAPAAQQAMALTVGSPEFQKR